MLQALYDIDVILPLLREDTVFVTPNERLARAVSQAYDLYQTKQGNPSWVKLPVMSLNRLFHRWLESARLAPGLDQQQALYLWEQLIQQDMPEDHTTGWLSPKALAVEAYKAYELMYHYDLRSDARFESMQGSDRECRMFYRWSQHFEARLKLDDLHSQAQQWQALSNHRCVNRCTLVLLEFDTLTPLQRRVCEGMSGALEFIHSSTEAEVLGQRGQVYAFEDNDAQLRQVALWAQAHYMTKPEQRLGIVVPDLTQQRERLEYQLRRAFDRELGDYTSLPVNFSAGIPALDVPLIKQAIALLRLSAGTLAPSELLMLARSPYLDLCASHTEYAVLREALYELSPSQLGEAELLRLFDVMSKDTPDPKLARWWLSSRLKLNKTLVFDQVQAWESVLSRAGWPGNRGLDSVEYQAFSLWQRTLRALTRWDALQARWSCSDAIGLLERSLQNQVFQPETDDQAIQVLGTLEASGLHFDEVIVLDTVAGHFPERLATSPFLPKILQREYALPRCDEQQEYGLARRLLSGLEARSGAIRFCYVAVADDSRVAVTPILQHLVQRAVPVAPAEPHMLPGHWVVELESRGVPLDELGGDLQGGAYRLGVQATCPMQAYSRYRLGVPEALRLSQGLHPKEQGLILHRAMELLWRSKTELAQLSEGDVGLAVTRALGEITAERRALLPPLALQAEQLRLETAIKAWVALEAQRQPFTVIEHEQAHEVQIGAWRFKLRLDRMDRLHDGATLVLDYKSSAPSITSWSEGRLEQAQLPLYTLALGDQAKACAVAQISSTKPPKLAGVSAIEVAKGVKVIDDWGKQIQHWRQAIGELIVEVETGEASVRPSAKACRYCDFAGMCRVGRIDDDEGEANE